jgi:glycosyltransferase involved in cell wall biosynthesis
MGARDLVAGSGVGAVMASPTAASVAQQLALLADPATRASMGAAARARAESLTWERTTAAIAQAYDEVLARR